MAEYPKGWYETTFGELAYTNPQTLDEIVAYWSKLDPEYGKALRAIYTADPDALERALSVWKRLAQDREKTC